jgi:hypothetical protein
MYSFGFHKTNENKKKEEEIALVARKLYPVLSSRRHFRGFNLFLENLHYITNKNTKNK